MSLTSVNQHAMVFNLEKSKSVECSTITFQSNFWNLYTGRAYGQRQGQ